ncbi:MAG: 4-hydroxy-tetrahydrodipicolinate reductase [Nannocystaceae bacterium]
MTNEPQLVPIHVVGARGRMGTSIIREVVQSENFILEGAVDRTGGPGLGHDAGRLVGLTETGVKVGEVLEPRPGTVVLDFSLPEATPKNLARCVEHNVPLVCGTTGGGEVVEQLIREASASIPIVYAANFSAGVTMLIALAGIAARSLGPKWEAEIVELHHRHKKDAPSGTALRIAHEVASSRDQTLSEIFVADRSTRHQARSANEVGIFGMRGGDSVGEHTLMLLSDGERLELTHRATDRRIFARGALRAARWVVDKPPGVYDMRDVLGIEPV